MLGWRWRKFQFEPSRIPGVEDHDGALSLAALFAPPSGYPITPALSEDLRVRQSGLAWRLPSAEPLCTKVQDAAARTWAMGDTLGKLVRNLLKLWEGKGEAEDDAIHKTMPELVLELGSTERKIRTAIRTGLEEGILEARPGYRPSDRRQTVYYTLNLIPTSLVAYRSEATRIRQKLERERRPGHRRSLAAKLRKLETAISDLELRFLDADEAGFDAFGVCERCGDEFCDGGGCLYTEDAYGWHDQDAPCPTDADAEEVYPDELREAIGESPWEYDPFASAEREQLENSTPEQRRVHYEGLELRVVALSKDELEVSGVFGRETLYICSPSPRLRATITPSSASTRTASSSRAAGSPRTYTASTCGTSPP